LAFLGCCLLLSLKGDGRFPLPSTVPEARFQLLLLPYTLCLITAFGLVLAPALWSTFGIRPLAGVRRDTIAFWGAIAFEGLTLALFIAQARKYAAFGYELSAPIVILVFGLIFGGLALVFRADGHRGPGRLLAFACGAHGLVAAVSVVSFPLHPGRSDMLPLIVSASERLLSGQSPYALRYLPHAVPLTYLPGLWLAYLPAVWLRLDPRVVQLATTVGAVVLAVQAAPRERRSTASVLGAFLLLTPYLQYRHEIYLGVHWLTLACFVFFENRGQHRLAALAFGWGLAASQFSWVLVPLYLTYVWRSRGPRACLVAAGLAATVGLALVLPFLAWAPHDFLAGVLGHWEKTLNVTTANLSYFLAQVLPLGALRWIQAGGVLLITALSWRRDAVFGECLRFMTLALLAFVLLNTLVWVYFYLTVVFLALLHAAARADSVGTVPAGCQPLFEGRDSATVPRQATESPKSGATWLVAAADPW
jgi:hypothetical protein